jgi:integrase
VADVTPVDVQAWIAKLSSRLLSPSSVRRAFTVLDQLFDMAADLGFTAASPTDRARLPRVTRNEMRFLTPAQLEYLADTIDPRYRVMVLTMALATLRIGEATGLRRSDVDVIAGTIRIANNVVEVAGKLHEGPPKTAAGRRTMRLPSSLLDELADHLDRFSGATYVFPRSDGEVLHAGDWRTCHWRPAVEQAELAPLRPHDLKHTGVAFLALAGVDPSEIARRAGHSSVAFTYDRYGHLFPEVDKQAAEKLEAVRHKEGVTVSFLRQSPRRENAGDSLFEDGNARLKVHPHHRDERPSQVGEQAVPRWGYPIR